MSAPQQSLFGYGYRRYVIPGGPRTEFNGRGVSTLGEVLGSGSSGSSSGGTTGGTEVRPPQASPAPQGQGTDSQELVSDLPTDLDIKGKGSGEPPETDGEAQARPQEPSEEQPKGVPNLWRDVGTGIAFEL